ncbi:HaeIII family restriction endonuclease [Campylobacter jejuni]|uniref:HaeIII family restriction endonuclease n=1 Tax=Campylobacter jejuni TaxID=197 RepID=UPI0005780873|nr:HaeIII family restriction endonuclease [Campylobacter jejuni]
MSNKSNNNGRAYEFAFLKEFIEEIENLISYEIVKNKSCFTNEKTYLQNENKEIFSKSSKSIVKEIIKLEPILSNAKEKFFIKFQDDSKGKIADVRDIVINCNVINYEIGFSLKHNHEAVKHSRLSEKIDFAFEWYQGKCSKDYWDNVLPIFQFLRENKGENWSFINDKINMIYKPVLKAFKNEIIKINTKQVEQLCRYLIGLYDFYKIISIDKEKCTYMQTFNFDNNLGKNYFNKKSIIEIPLLKLPDKILYCDIEGDNKLILCFNHGWQFSFRIHNASSRIEPSLKFDIKLIGLPSGVLCFKCFWND